METVCAVVVTYNRKKLLLECLDSLCKQTRTLQAIYIIDNASSDGTEENLFNTDFIKMMPPKNIIEPWIYRSIFPYNKMSICYVKMPENTGGAGGFNEGVKRVYEAGFDWIWLMDEDVEAFDHALEMMLQYKKVSLCIHPSKIFPEGKKFIWQGILDTSGKVNHFKKEYFSSKNWSEVNYGCFEGMLIHRSIVEKIGYPPKIFFTMDDDTVYGYLASKFTTPIYLKHNLLIKKIDKSNHKKILGFKTNRLGDLALYYQTRNEFLKLKYIDIIDKKRFYIRIFSALIRESFTILILDKNWKRVRLKWMGFFHGLIGNFSMKPKNLIN